MENLSEVYFRSSSFGNLMTEARGSALTETQAKTLSDFEDRIREGLKPLTEPQRKTYLDLKARRDAPPKLSDTAESEIEKIWLLYERGYYGELDNKYVNKGLFNEQLGLGIVSDHVGKLILKNEDRVYKNNLTGEADGFFIIDGKKTVVDVKCSWDPNTFKNGKLSNVYEYQLRCYMYLYDVEEAWLCYCLTDAPDHIVTFLKRKEFYKYYHDGMTNEEVELLEKKLERVYKQIETNMIYSNNPAYSKEEMVKIFKITRDADVEAKMLSKIPQALEYYKNYKLNQV
jgi:hypothetical protein